MWICLYHTAVLCGLYVVCRGNLNVKQKINPLFPELQNLPHGKVGRAAPPMCTRINSTSTLFRLGLPPYTAVSSSGI